MPQEIQLNTAQQVAVGVTLFDTGVPPQPFAELPEGATLDFVSSDPNVVRVEVLPDGLNAILHSDTVGVASVAVVPGGSLAAFPPDTITVTIVNAEPGQLNLNVGTPTQES